MTSFPRIMDYLSHICIASNSLTACTEDSILATLSLRPLSNFLKAISFNLLLLFGQAIFGIAIKWATLTQTVPSILAFVGFAAHGKRGIRGLTVLLLIQNRGERI
jgi:hypothetical protein